MFGRNKFPDLPKPETVETFDPDLKQFMAPLHGQYSADLQAAMKGLGPDDFQHADHAYRELSTSVGSESMPMGNELDEGRLLMVQDLYSVLVNGKLTEVPAA